jgi:hypothetical protein
MNSGLKVHRLHSYQVTHEMADKPQLGRTECAGMQAKQHELNAVKFS